MLFTHYLGDRRKTLPIWAKNINGNTCIALYCTVCKLHQLLLNALLSSPHIFFTATLEVLLRKLETVEQNQREALLLLRANRHGDPGEASVELLQAQTQAELQELEEHLKNREFTKKW